MSGTVRAVCASGLVAFGLIAALTPAQAAPSQARSAAAMTESEPNDTALEADGPIPADGYTATRATPDDHDMFVLRLQPQRQVTMTLRRVSGCRYSVNSNPTTISLTRSDGKSQIDFSNWSSEVLTRSWTTPAVAAEYLGDVSGDYWWEGNQCTVSLTVSPADAVIEGPLPPRAPRDAILTPVDAVEGRDFSTTVTGHAYSGDTLRTWVASAGNACTSTDEEVTETAVPAGAFTVPVAMNAGDPGYATVCMVLRSTEASLISDVIVPGPVAIRPVKPMSLVSNKVRLDRRGKGVLKTRCDLPAPEVCTTTMKIRSNTGRSIAQISGTVASGQVGKLRFKVSRKVARLITASGRMRVVASGTVTRVSWPTIGTGRIRLQLLPPRR